MTDEEIMRLAIAAALEGARDNDEVPVGAAIARNGEIIALTHNRKEEKNCAVFHAEIEAIIEASDKIGNWYLDGCTIYVTLEPCPMCAGAIINSRLDKLVFGAKDPKSGAVGSVISLNDNPGLNHRFEVRGGVLESECAAILSEFFKGKRIKKAESR